MLTYKMIKNIKVLVAFRREYSVLISYHIFYIDKIDKIFVDLLSEWGISLLGN